MFLTLCSLLTAYLPMLDLGIDATTQIIQFLKKIRLLSDLWLPIPQRLQNMFLFCSSVVQNRNIYKQLFAPS